jgi:hypothetical protein
MYMGMFKYILIGNVKIIAAEGKGVATTTVAHINNVVMNESTNEFLYKLYKKNNIKINEII